MRNIITVALLFFATTAFSQRVSVVLDGDTKEWPEDAHQISDSGNDGGALDITSLSASNDSRFLYLNFTLNEEILLNDNNELWMYLDTDADAATGYQVNGTGAELRWHFGGRQGYFGEEKVYHNDFNFVALPTITSDTFELRISRTALPDESNPLFTGNDIRIVFKDMQSGDVVPDEGAFFEYSFAENTNDFQPRSLLRATSTDVRVMSYNVLHDGIIKAERKPYFRRVIRATSPDVVVLNECWDATASQVKAVFDDFIPLPGNQSWHTLKKDDGNILVSRFPFLDSWAIHNDMRLTAALVDLPDNQYTNDFMVVGAHFRCCGANEARQREADAFVEFILDAKSEGGEVTIPENTPFFLAGDLNLVGYSQQLTTLLTGEIINDEFGEGGLPDWDNTPLFDVVSAHTDMPVANTWRSNTSSFWPGRLDFAIISNSVSKVLNSWVLETTNMSPDRLNAFNLEANDTQEASDHLPKVTDLAFTGPLAVSSVKQKQVTVLPNPASDKIDIIGEGIDSVRVIQLSTGQIIKTIFHENQGGTFRIQSGDFKPGVYLLEIKRRNNKSSHYEKIIITR